MAVKWIWKKGRYDLFFKLCAAFINIHVTFHPLRSEDAENQATVKNRFYAIGTELGEKRKRTQTL